MTYHGWIFYTLLFLFWELLPRFFPKTSLLFPPLSNVLATGFGLIFNAIFWQNVAISLGRVLAGLFIGVSVGFFLGILMGTSKLWESNTRPLVTTLQAIPKIAILPLLIFWIGIGEAPKIVVISLSAFFPILLSALSSIKYIEKQLIWAALSTGLNEFQTTFYIRIPVALPQIFAGLRLAVGFSFLTLVTAEMFATTKGIGYAVMEATETFQMDKAIWTVFFLGFINNRASWLIRLIEKKIFKWHPSEYRNHE